MKKSKVIDSIQDMQDEFSVDELIERLMILHKIEKGRQDIKEGKFLMEEEAKKRLGKWLK